MSALPVARYEQLLKKDLQCWRCHSTQKNLPTLKIHLQEEWDKEKRKSTVQKKRKREDVTAVAQGENEAPDSTRGAKRSETLESPPEPHS
jgi:aprataxin